MTSYVAWLRAGAGRARLPLAYVTGLVRDAAGRVLFQRRADFGDAWWGLPGGLLELGETPEAALAREVLEETGLTVTVGPLTGLYSSPRYNFAYPNGDQVQQITLCYACTVVSGGLLPQLGEVEALAYFVPNALPPTSSWYAAMLKHGIVPHGLAAAAPPYFDPPESQPPDSPWVSPLALRPILGPAPLVWPGAGAIVFDDQGRLLLQQRADNGLWTPPGGALDLGESLARTAQRECEEETGLRVAPTALLGVEAGRRVVYPNGDELSVVQAVFACRVIGGALRPDGSEVADLGYFAADALPPTSAYYAARLPALFAWHAARSAQAVAPSDPAPSHLSPPTSLLSL
ncbi:MAG: NUDIX domain-containing protein [Anaerolineales bacterium]|nr:NUDIX domain-containing protein [Anaerolineales bacterium]